MKKEIIVTNFVSTITFIIVLLFANSCANKKAHNKASLNCNMDSNVSTATYDIIEEQNKDKFQHDCAYNDTIYLCASPYTDIPMVKAIKAIVDNNATQLASVSAYPIGSVYEYPMPYITDSIDMVQQFDTFFDDSIKNILRTLTWNNVDTTINKLTHEPLYTFSLGYYLWFDSISNLLAINYESEAYKKLKSKLIKEEQMDLHESPYYEPRQCYISLDSMLLVRVAEYNYNAPNYDREHRARIYVFTRDKQLNAENATIYDVGMDSMGTCGYFWWGLWINKPDSIGIEVWDAQCGPDNEDYIYNGVHFPADVPSHLQQYAGKEIELQRCFWRDAKQWW